MTEGPEHTVPEASPPPLPPPLPPHVLAYRQPDTTDPVTHYQKVADTVGFVPSLRWKDNLYQLVWGAIGAVAGFVALPLLFPQAPGARRLAITGAVLGLIAGIVLYGIVLGIVRLIGAIRR